MLEEARHGFVSGAEAPGAIESPGGMLSFKARGEQTGGALTAFESIVAPGHGPPFHLHVREDEVIYVLEGRLRVRLEETVEEAPSGSVAFLPRGVPHAWQNVGETPARLFVLLTPAAAGLEKFFERAAEVPEETRTSEAFRRFAEDAGMVVLGPPLARSHPAPRVQAGSSPATPSNGCAG